MKTKTVISSMKIDSLITKAT